VAQAWVLQLCAVAGFAPEHRLSATVAPELERQVTARVCVPLPHVAEHRPQLASDQL
jgi:hypothetical protein